MDKDGSPRLRLAERVNAMLADTELSVLSDDSLRDLLVQAEQAGRALQAVQAAAMNAMVERARLQPSPAGHHRYDDHGPDEFVVDEVAVLLSCTRTAAGVRLATAWQAQRFPTLALRWRSGALDDAKVRVIAEGVAPLVDAPDEGSRQVHDPVVQALVEAAADYGSTHTTGQLRQWLGRRVITVDPDAADVRYQRALADRRVVITPGSDGMSVLWALLPSVRARQIQQVLSKVAHDAPGQDPRTADQRRADGLYDLLVGTTAPPAIETSLILTGAVGDDGHVRLDASGELAGVGTITRTQVVELLGGDPPGAGSRASSSNRPRLLPCDATTGALVVMADASPGYRPSVELDRQVRERDLTCRFPGCRRSAVGSANGVDVDHTAPWPGGQTDAANLACLCRRHHRLKHLGRWSVRQVGDGVLHWTTPTGRLVLVAGDQTMAVRRTHARTVIEDQILDRICG